MLDYPQRAIYLDARISRLLGVNPGRQCCLFVSGQSLEGDTGLILKEGEFWMRRQLCLIGCYASFGWQVLVTWVLVSISGIGPCLYSIRMLNDPYMRSM